MPMSTPFLTLCCSPGLKHPVPFPGFVRYFGKNSAEQQEPEKEHPENPEFFSHLGDGPRNGVVVATATEER